MGSNQEEDGGGGRRREEEKRGVWLVNGFWQTQGGIFAVLAGADSGYSPERRTDTRIRTPSLKGSLKRKGHRALKVSYALDSLTHLVRSVREKKREKREGDRKTADGKKSACHTLLCYDIRARKNRTRISFSWVQNIPPYL